MFNLNLNPDRSEIIHLQVPPVPTKIFEQARERKDHPEIGIFQFIRIENRGADALSVNYGRGEDATKVDQIFPAFFVWTSPLVLATAPNYIMAQSTGVGDLDVVIYYEYFSIAFLQAVKRYNQDGDLGKFLDFVKKGGK